jgi:hypothetical protein
MHAPSGDIGNALQMLAHCVTHGYELGALEATAQALADCFEESLRRMVGRVDQNSQQDVNYWLDLKVLRDTLTDVIGYCVHVHNDQVGVKSLLELVQFVCGYHYEDVGMEAVYRFKRLVDLCRRRESARVLDMAATNTAQWMERTMF